MGRRRCRICGRNPTAGLGLNRNTATGRGGKVTYGPPSRVEGAVFVAFLEEAPCALAPVEEGPCCWDTDDGEDDLYAEGCFEVEWVEDESLHEAVEDEHYGEGDY